ncbi:unnamed protein product [Closterium sp. Yama58-4]|nr:unnamed protein product [Closterium sp. Yama58-4]
MDMGRQETLSHGLADMPDGNPVTIATAGSLVDRDAAARDGESETSGDSYCDAESFSSSGESSLNQYGQEGDEEESLSSHVEDEEDEIGEAYNGAKRSTWPLVVSMRELEWWQQAVLVLLVAVGLTGVSAAMAAVAKVGDLLFLPAPVWLPTGLALFAVLALGYRIWPALFLAGTALSLTYGALHVALPRLQLILYSLVIATDRTLFVLLLAFFLMRFLRRQPTDLTPPLIVSLPYMLFPGVLWAAVRFNRHGSGLMLLLVVLIACCCTARGWGPLVREKANETILQLQVFVVVVGLVGVVVAAAVRDTNRLRKELRRLNARLEGEVQRRTEQIRQYNEDLKKSKEELEEAGRAKTEFLANMSHEIR